MSPSESPSPESLPPGERLALDVIDAWALDPERRMDAVAAYVREQDEIDPETDDGARRVRFLLENVPQVRDTFLDVERVFARAGADCVDRAVADRALVAAASLAMVRRDDTSAFERLAEALRRSRGTGSGIEISACLNLGSLLSGQGRSAEAFVVAGRAKRLAQAQVAHRAIGMVCVTRSTAFRDFERFDLAAAELDEAEHALRMEPDGAIARAALASRLDLLWQSGCAAEALELLDATEHLLVEGAPLQEAWWASFRAHALLDLGRAGEARAVIAEHLETFESRDDWRIRSGVLQAFCALELDSVEAALEITRTTLDFAESMSGATGSHRSWATRLLPLLERCGADDELARALDLLAVENLKLIVDIDRTAREIPEVTDIHPEDRTHLAEGRCHFVAAHAAMLERIARRLERVHDGDPAALLLSPGDDDLCRVCAWCGRLLSRDGDWLAIGHLVGSSNLTAVTHGMCPDCLADLRPGAAADEAPA